MSFVDPFVLETLVSGSDAVSLVSALVEQESRFVDLRVIAPAAAPGSFEIGQSRVLTDLGNLTGKLVERIEQILPQALDKFRIPSFRISRVEAQATATNNGQSFRFRGAPPGAELTFVFALYREPKGFTGGDIRIYNAIIRGGKWAPADTYQTAVLRLNTLILFPSRFTHEILSVRCPSRAFANSLFTVTGWLCK